MPERERTIQAFLQNLDCSVELRVLQMGLDSLRRCLKLNRRQERTSRLQEQRTQRQVHTNRQQEHKLQSEVLADRFEKQAKN